MLQIGAKDFTVTGSHHISLTSADLTLMLVSILRLMASREVHSRLFQKHKNQTNLKYVKNHQNHFFKIKLCDYRQILAIQRSPEQPEVGVSQWPSYLISVRQAAIISVR